MLLKNQGEQSDIPVMRAIPWIERVIAAEKDKAIESLREMKGHTEDGGRWFKVCSSSSSRSSSSSGGGGGAGVGGGGYCNTSTQL